MANIKQKSYKHTKQAFMGSVLIYMALFSYSLAVEAKESDITPSAVIRLVNEARKDAGVGILMENQKLKTAAEAKANDMIVNNYFAHISPQGKSPWDFILEKKYDYLLAGENLAIDYSSVKEQQKAWMDSPLHRSNILNPEYKEIGVAVAKGEIEGRKTIITVQEFGAQAVLISQSQNVSKISSEKKAVAGVSVNNIQTPKTSFAANSSQSFNNIDLKKLFEENQLTFAGWLIAVALAIAMTLIDTVYVIFKKHRHL